MIDAPHLQQSPVSPLLGQAKIEVYCDGSVTSTKWTDPYFSSDGLEFVGRGLVLIPTLDRALIAQSRVGMVTAKGDPRSSEAERFAVETALAHCRDLGLSDFVVYTDCMSAVDRNPGEPVAWCSQRQIGIANTFLRRILDRAAYLRKSEKCVTKRRPLADHQIEFFKLFNSPREEFRLSSSAAWKRVLSSVADRERYRVPPGSVDVIALASRRAAP